MIPCLTMTEIQTWYWDLLSCVWDLLLQPTWLKMTSCCNLYYIFNSIVLLCLSIVGAVVDSVSRLLLPTKSTTYGSKWSDRPKPGPPVIFWKWVACKVEQEEICWAQLWKSIVSLWPVFYLFMRWFIGPWGQTHHQRAVIWEGFIN